MNLELTGLLGWLACERKRSACLHPQVLGLEVCAVVPSFYVGASCFHSKGFAHPNQLASPYPFAFMCVVRKQ